MHKQMIQLKINGRTVDVTPGTTVLEAARAIACDIPTLCYCSEVGPLTSCMVCVVRDAADGSTMPACAAPAQDGMNIVTDDAELRELRRDTLRLLLEEHAGDCEGPCTRACPAALDTPRMLCRIEEGDCREAAVIARDALVFPAILGRVCPAPCERVCRRGQYDSPIAIRSAHGNAAEQFLDDMPAPLPASGKSVAIVGAGLAGLAAAWGCARNGHACHVFEKADQYLPQVRGKAPDAVIEAECAFIEAWGVHMQLNTKIAGQEAQDHGVPPAIGDMLEHHDAVILTGKQATLFEAPNLYHAKEEKMPVRAVAAGKRAACQVNAALEGRSYDTRRSFNSKLGRLTPEEIEIYAKNRHCPRRSQKKVTVTVFTQGPTQASEQRERDGSVPDSAARDEAARCLHCDCLKPASCKLRRYAEAYEVRVSATRELPRPKVAPIEVYGEIVYEPGKCIKCGICVEITRKRGIHPGMALTGRGMKSRVRGALGALLSDALGDAGAACVCACPTAALAFNREETADTCQYHGPAP